MFVVLRHSFIFSFLLGLLLFFGFISAVFAQETSGLQVRPAIVENRVNPGDVYPFSIRVTNIGTDTKKLFVVKHNIQGLAEDGTPIFVTGVEPTPYEISSWISSPLASVVLGPGETQHVPFTITIPKDATPGAHLGGVFFELEPPERTGIGSSVGFRVGTIVNLRIAGDTVEEATFREFQTDKFVYSRAAVNFKARVENTGNVLLRPHGIIEINNMRGEKVASVLINEQGAAVFPKSERIFETMWENESFSIGRYEAIASIVYGEDERKTITATRSFWVIPFKILLIGFGSVIGLLLLLIIGVKLHIKRKLNALGYSGSGMRPRGAGYGVPSHLATTTIILLLLVIVLFVLLFIFIA